MRFARYACVFALCACGDTSNTCAEETCNGVDDDCNGLVDETCPCEPFLVETPGDMERLVVAGTDWVGIDFDTLVNVTQTGTVMTGAPLMTVPDRLAWNGTDLVYLSGTTLDTYLVFIKPNGDDPRMGPGFGESVINARGAIQFTGTGYDVVFTRNTTTGSGVELVYAPTDLAGAWLETKTSSLLAKVSHEGLTSIDRQPIALWELHANFDPTMTHYIGTPFGGAILGSSEDVSRPHFATNGSAVMVVNQKVYHFNGSAVTVVAMPPGRPLAVAWTGRTWAVVMAGTRAVDLVELDDTFAVVSTTALLPTLAPTDPIADYQVLRADAAAIGRRVLVTIVWQRSNGTPTPEFHHHAIQSCSSAF